MADIAARMVNERLSDRIGTSSRSVRECASFSGCRRTLLQSFQTSPPPPESSGAGCEEEEEKMDDPLHRVIEDGELDDQSFQIAQLA